MYYRNSGGSSYDVNIEIDQETALKIAIPLAYVSLFLILMLVRITCAKGKANDFYVKGQGFIQVKLNSNKNSSN